MNRGIGAHKPTKIWREFNRLSFETTPVMSQRAICKRIGISRVTARGMWAEIAAYRRAGKIHPRLQEIENAETLSSKELPTLRGDGRRGPTYETGLEIPSRRGARAEQGTGLLETRERVLAA